MARTENDHQKSDHMSWMEWINEALDRANELYKEAIINLGLIARQTISKIIKELRFFISKLTVVDFICGSLTLGVLSLASLFLASGIGLVSYQAFLWIRDGVWSEYTITVVFNFIFKNTVVAQWLSNPESWFGLQKALEWLLQNIPLSVALIIPSITVLCGMILISITGLTFRYYQFKAKKNI
jgi:hypothetical protein